MNARAQDERTDGQDERALLAHVRSSPSCPERSKRRRRPRDVIRRTRGQAQRVHHQDLPLPARRAGRARALPRGLARHRAGLRRHRVARLDQCLLLHAGAQRLRRDAERDGGVPDRDQGPRPAARGPDAQPGRDVRTRRRALSPPRSRTAPPAAAPPAACRRRSCPGSSTTSRRCSSSASSASCSPRARSAATPTSEAISSPSASRPAGWSAFALWFAFGRDSFLDYAHYGTAVPMFGLIVAVALVNAAKVDEFVAAGGTLTMGHGRDVQEGLPRDRLLHGRA